MGRRNVRGYITVGLAYAGHLRRVNCVPIVTGSDDERGLLEAIESFIVAR